MQFAPMMWRHGSWTGCSAGLEGEGAVLYSSVQIMQVLLSAGRSLVEILGRVLRNSKAIVDVVGSG